MMYGFGFEDYTAYTSDPTSKGYYGLPPVRPPPVFSPYVMQAVGATPEPIASVQQWWGQQTTATKIAVIGGGLLVLGAIAYAMVPPPRRAAPNKASKKGRPRVPVPICPACGAKKGHVHVKGCGLEHGHKSRGRLMLPAKKKCAGKKCSCKRYPNVASCRCSAPAKYRRAGARKKSDYAFPECWMFPVHTAKYTRKASQRFAMHKHRYAPKIRGQIARRIDKAKRRFRVGEYHV